ncbi:Na+/phosphate symporter [Nitzschia inconspicua]|uniref:Na+/phosphate symporter n=1 Tax=Nitzschia inconspicua TaxID=303405 RepID=A0A9K3KDW4_9STRA|nr:Na+/phosphate symporter [Nitzschia inconspicua]
MTDIETNDHVPEKAVVKPSAHGTTSTTLEVEEDRHQASWSDVCRSCFCHSPAEWGMILFRLFWILFFLYFFILGLEILGDGAQVMTGCVAGALFGDDQNPVSSLMIGIIATVLLQSSSSTTSIVVTMVGAGAISVQAGIYMIMGSNIGTSVTSTIVAMGQLGDGDQLERAFAGATVHDMFNFLTVAVFFPIEVISNMLFYLTEACVRNANTGDGAGTRDNFVKKYIEPVGLLLIRGNRRIIQSVAQGGTCEEFYPTVCEDPENPTGSTCTVGLIGCPSGDEPCPALFQAGATVTTDQTSGFVAFLIGVTMLFICLGGLVTVLSRMLSGVSSDVIYKATDINGYLAIIIGCGLTVAVQSSSITTSTLTPLVGMDLIRLEQMYPITLGANIGTTVTGIIAAFVSEGTNALQVALAHLFFNIFGIIIFYPIPYLRRIPMHASRQLGKATRAWKGFPILYILVLFFAIPLLLVGLSSMFVTKKTAQVVVASIIVVVLAIGLVIFVFWWARKGGREHVGNYFAKRQRRVQTIETLPWDMAWAQRRIKEMMQVTGNTSPSQAITVSSKGKDVYADVADEMQQVTNTVNGLVHHLGLEKEVDPEGLGRLYHKEKEVMPSVDMASKKVYIATVIAVGAVCFGFFLWAVIALFLTGSVATKALAGYLLCMLGLFLIWRIVSLFSGGKAALSEEAYVAKELQKMCKASYAETMAQMKADLNHLVVETQLPLALDNVESKADGKDVDEDTE